MYAASSMDSANIYKSSSLVAVVTREAETRVGAWLLAFQRGSRCELGTHTRGKNEECRQHVFAQERRYYLATRQVCARLGLTRGPTGGLGCRVGQLGVRDRGHLGGRYCPSTHVSQHWR